MSALSGSNAGAGGTARVKGEVTVGVDIGTTSVKALAVDADGHVVARARVPHRIVVSSPDRLEHDARAAWRNGPRKAYAAVLAESAAPISGLSVTAMVPSLTAVDKRGIPLQAGLLYGDGRGVPSGKPPGDDGESAIGGLMGAGMPDAEGFLRWAVQTEPGAAGYWPCQAVATYALCGTPAVDTAMTASLGALHTWGAWNEALLATLGVEVAQLPVVVPMCEAAGVIPGTDTVFCGGTVDALCDQIVSGASEPGDVLAIFGATLVVWIVTDKWVEVPGLITVPHTVPDRVLVGGPSNAGALFVDWARTLLRGAPRSARIARDASTTGRDGDHRRVPVWLPYLRGERTPFNDPLLRASVHGLDITQGPEALERAAFEASGFVIRRLLQRSGLPGHRVVASGGGSASSPWMSAVADATGLPIDSVAVPEGAALGAAYMARMAVGLEDTLDGSSRWARTGRRHHPDPTWATAAGERYKRFIELGPGG